MVVSHFIPLGVWLRLRPGNTYTHQPGEMTLITPHAGNAHPLPNPSVAP
ncbi:MAG: hypothetical protein OXH85_06280 [Truepera sp.]|nr:hypothetical protein [Truepera sp.]